MDDYPTQAPRAPTSRSTVIDRSLASGQGAKVMRDGALTVDPNAPGMVIKAHRVAGDRPSGIKPWVSPNARPVTSPIGRALVSGKGAKVARDGSLTVDPSAPGMVIKPHRVAATPPTRETAAGNDGVPILSRRQLLAGQSICLRYPVISRRRIRIHLPPGVVETIRTETLAFPEGKETGGVLIGRREGDDVYVARATGPGPSADHQELEFTADVAHAQAILFEEARRARVVWVGGWHRHPRGARFLSDGDEKGIRRLFREDKVLPFHVQIVTTMDEKGWNLDAYFVEKGGPVEEAKVVTYEGDPFARIRSLVDVDTMAGMSVTVFGVGSVGSQVALALAQNGVGALTLVDHDVLSPENVTRHAAGLPDVGKPKVDVVARLIRERNPTAVVETSMQRVEGDCEELRFWIAQSDVVAVCLDDERAKHEINCIARELKKTAIYGGVYPGGTGGDVLRVAPETLCYECFALYHGTSMARPDARVKVDYMGDGQATRDQPGLGIDVAFMALFQARWILQELAPRGKEPQWEQAALQWTSIRDEGFPKPFQAEFHNLPVHPKCRTCHPPARTITQPVALQVRPLRFRTGGNKPGNARPTAGEGP